MTYDVARFRRVMKTIEAEPETFHMPNYGFQKFGCATTMCLAGHTCVDEGLTLSWHPAEQNAELATGLTDGRPIHETAAELLGLDYAEANDIFLATHVKTAAQLWEVIEGATDGAVTEHDRAE